MFGCCLRKNNSCKPPCALFGIIRGIKTDHVHLQVSMAYCHWPMHGGAFNLIEEYGYPTLAFPASLLLGKMCYGSWKFEQIRIPEYRRQGLKYRKHQLFRIINGRLFRIFHWFRPLIMGIPPPPGKLTRGCWWWISQKRNLTRIIVKVGGLGEHVLDTIPSFVENSSKKNGPMQQFL